VRTISDGSRGDFGSPSHVRIFAQQAVYLEPSLARVHHSTGTEFTPATTLRTGVFQSKQNDSRPLTTLVGDKPQYGLWTAVTSPPVPPTNLLQGRTLRSANLRHTVLANASLSVKKVQQRDRLLLPLSNSTSNL